MLLALNPRQVISDVFVLEIRREQLVWLRRYRQVSIVIIHSKVFCQIACVHLCVQMRASPACMPHALMNKAHSTSIAKFWSPDMPFVHCGRWRDGLRVKFWLPHVVRAKRPSPKRVFEKTQMAIQTESCSITVRRPQAASPVAWRQYQTVQTATYHHVLTTTTI